MQQEAPGEGLADGRLPACQAASLASRKLTINKGPTAAEPYDEAKTLRWRDDEQAQGAGARGLLQDARRPQPVGTMGSETLEAITLGK